MDNIVFKKKAVWRLFLESSKSKSGRTRTGINGEMQRYTQKECILEEVSETIREDMFPLTLEICWV